MGLDQTRQAVVYVRVPGDPGQDFVTYYEHEWALENCVFCISLSSPQKNSNK